MLIIQNLFVPQTVYRLLTQLFDAIFVLFLIKWCLKRSISIHQNALIPCLGMVRAFINMRL